MLRQCKWEGKEVNCSEIFKPVITDTGVCCAFNLESDLKESNYSSLVKEMQVSRKFQGVSVTGFQTHTGASERREIRNINPRLDKGLEIIIDRNFDR